MVKPMTCLALLLIKSSLYPFTAFLDTGNIPNIGACSYTNLNWLAIYLGKGMNEETTKGISLCALIVPAAIFSKKPPLLEKEVWYTKFSESSIESFRILSSIAENLPLLIMSNKSWPLSDNLLFKDAVNIACLNTLSENVFNTFAAFPIAAIPLAAIPPTPPPAILASKSAAFLNKFVAWLGIVAWNVSLTTLASYGFNNALYTSKTPPNKPSLDNSLLPKPTLIIFSACLVPASMNVLNPAFSKLRMVVAIWEVIRPNLNLSKPLQKPSLASPLANSSASSLDILTTPA